MIRGGKLANMKQYTDVKIVLLLKILKPGCIKLEKRIPTIPVPRVTRSNERRTLTPANRKSISLKEGSDQSNPASYSITGGDLKLEFSKIMLRDSHGAERDVFVTEDRHKVLEMHGSDEFIISSELEKMNESFIR